MPQSYGPVYLHIVFGTKHRENVLTPQLHTDFARYITPVLHECKSRLIAEGGMPDHVHLLIDLGREIAVKDLLRDIKSKSSGWLEMKLGIDFSWQGGYGVFSVSPSHLQQVVRYIENQEEHHRQKTFREEFAEMLKAAGIEFDPKYFLKDDE